MVNLNTRTAAIVVAVGFFLGCSSGIPLAERDLSEQSFTVEEIQNEVRKVNEEIAQSPFNAKLYYLKGYLLFLLAKEPDQSIPKEDIYTRMKKALQKAKKEYDIDNNTKGIQETDKLLHIAWSREHNLGVESAQQTSELTETEIKRAFAHFHNATLILPDSLASYSASAQMLGEAGQYEEAIRTLENALGTIDDLPPPMWERLAFLYMQTEQFRNAIDAFEKAKTDSDNVNIEHGLANAYVAAGLHEKAIDLLPTLINKNPENPIYKLTLGQEYYLTGSDYLNGFSDESAGEIMNEIERYREAKSFFFETENQFKEILALNSENEDALRKIANTYYNIAAGYQKILPAAADPYKTDIEQQISAYLTQAISVYKSLARISNLDETYWSQLYQAYRYLGLNEKAQRAKSQMN